MSVRVSLLLLVCWLAACEPPEKVARSVLPMQLVEQGVRLMPTHCNTCHGVGEFGIDEMLAPPLWGVRAHYLAHFSEPDAFVDAITEFLLEPQAAASCLPLELAHYGLKAPVSLTESELRSVAWAIYAGQVERPVWAREYRKRHQNCSALW